MLLCSNFSNITRINLLLIIMENHLSYFSMLPLKEIALRRVVIILWNEPDILASMTKFDGILSSDYIEECEGRQTVESKVTDSMSKLLPKELTEQMLHLVNPVGLQIRSWVQFHDIYLYSLLGVPIVAKLYWTTVGTIDYRKTAEELLRFEKLDIVKRYKLACLYCLDEYIPGFWKELPENVKRTFDKKDASQVERVNLECCWPYILKEEHNKLKGICAQYYHSPTSFQKHAVVFAAANGNKAAAQYFFEKLTDDEERQGALYAATYLLFSRNPGKSTGEFPPEEVADTACYLLSLMSHRRQMKLFRMLPCRALRFFLEWPWRDLFFEIADRIWDFLPAYHYIALLWTMTERFETSEYYFSKLFQEFFTRSPVNLRKEFVEEECRTGHFFRTFFNLSVSQFACSETVKAILRNVDAAERVRLVSSVRVLNVFQESIFFNELDRVRVCLREATLSKEDGVTLKKAVMGILPGNDEEQIQNNKPILDKFFELLDETST